MRVLVTDPSYKNTTAIVRSLGVRNFTVDLLCFTDERGKKIDGQALYSRYCRNVYYVRYSKSDLPGFIHDLVSLLKKEKFDVLLPLGTYTVIPISKYANLIRPYVAFPFPNYKLVELAHDKLKMIHFANGIGVPIPKTLPSNLWSSRKEYFGTYPLIIKTRKGASSTGVFKATSKNEVSLYLKNLQKREAREKVKDCIDSSSPMLQEYISGTIIDVCVLAQTGDVLAHVVQKRITTLPIDGGSGMINQTIDAEDCRLEAFKLIKALKWEGICMIEFKLDANGKPRLLEINPKFWGTLDLSIQSGVDFPYLACLFSKKQEIPKTEYKRGLTYRWLFPDGVKTIKASHNKISFISKFFAPFQANSINEIRFNDLGPNLFEIRKLLK